jgi:hypothetical protein
MSMLDYIMGWIEIGVDMVVSALFAMNDTVVHGKEADWKDVFYDSVELDWKDIVDIEGNTSSLATSYVQTAVLENYYASGDPHEPERRAVEWTLASNVYGLETVSGSFKVEKARGGELKAVDPQLGGLYVEPPDVDRRKQYKKGMTRDGLDLSDWGEVL